MKSWLSMKGKEDAEQEQWVHLIPTLGHHPYRPCCIQRYGPDAPPIRRHELPRFCHDFALQNMGLVPTHPMIPIGQAKAATKPKKLYFLVSFSEEARR